MCSIASSASQAGLVGPIWLAHSMSQDLVNALTIRTLTRRWLSFLRDPSVELAAGSQTFPPSSALPVGAADVSVALGSFLEGARKDLEVLL